MAGMTDDRAAAYLMEISPELRGCAILDRDGEVLAASGEHSSWRGPARELIAAVDAAGKREASHAHVATGEGEVFMVREGDRVAVAVAERFTLASLVLFDLRAALHGRLDGGSG